MAERGGLEGEERTARRKPQLRGYNNIAKENSTCGEKVSTGLAGLARQFYNRGRISLGRKAIRESLHARMGSRARRWMWQAHAVDAVLQACAVELFSKVVECVLQGCTKCTLTGDLPCCAAGPTMQLYKAGSLQGKGVNCIPLFKRPDYMTGTIPVQSPQKSFV